MTVPYHTHNFELPIAERADILAGRARDKVAVPASLGSAAAADKSEFATAAQGAKIEAAAAAAAKAQAKAEAAEQAAKAGLNNDFSRADGAAFNIPDGKILGFIGGRAVPVDPPAGGGKASNDAGNMLKPGADGGLYLALADVQQAIAAYISANKDSLKKELGGNVDVNLTMGWV